MTTLKLGTRASNLAMWQAKHVAARLREIHPGVEVELVPITTEGDRRTNVPLSQIGGKALFIKELEAAMRDGEIDLAVHSLKDVPGILPAGFEIACVPVREDPADAFISTKAPTLGELPQGAVLGTSSLRRTAQALAMRPDLQVVPLRGNVETRLRKLDAGDFDAIILAHAGLLRLGYTDRVTSVFDPDVFLPAVGQGALAIEIREGDAVMRERLAPLHHAETADCTAAERGFLAEVEGSCQVPIAARGRLQGDTVSVEALIASTSGSPLVRGTESGSREAAWETGRRLAQRLLEQGGREILASCLSATK